MRSIASPHSAPPDRFQRLKHKQYGHARQRRDSQKHRFHRCETEEIASGLPEQHGPHRPQHELLIQMEDPSIVCSSTWYPALEEGPAIGTVLDDSVNDMSHLGGNCSECLATEIRAVAILGDVRFELVAETE